MADAASGSAPSVSPGAATKRHLPWEPLARVLAVVTVERDACGASSKRIAAVTGIQRRQILVYQKQGWVTVDTADRICDRIGRNPHEIWDGYGAWPVDEDDEVDATPNARINRQRRARRQRQRATTIGANA